MFVSGRVQNQLQSKTLFFFGSFGQALKFLDPLEIWQWPLPIQITCVDVGASAPRTKRIHERNMNFGNRVHQPMSKAWLEMLSGTWGNPHHNWALVGNVSCHNISYHFLPYQSISYRTISIHILDYNYITSALLDECRWMWHVTGNHLALTLCYKKNCLAIDFGHANAFHSKSKDYKVSDVASGFSRKKNHWIATVDGSEIRLTSWGW